MKSTGKIINGADVFYLSGFSTKVIVLRFGNSTKPLCQILEAAPSSKYKVGKRVRISRRILYPIQGR